MLVYCSIILATSSSCFFAVIRENIKNSNSNFLASIAITRQSYQAILNDTWEFTRWTRERSTNARIAIMHATTRWVSRTLFYHEIYERRIETGKLAKTRLEDQQASRQVPLRMYLLRWRRQEVQKQRNEGISITPSASAQHHEGAALKLLASGKSKSKSK